MSGRVVESNVTVIDQVDFFEADYYTRKENLGIGSLQLKVFNENALVAWPLVTGVGVPNGLITSGRVYFSEVTGAPGYYSVRFRPNAVGYWRLVFNYPVGVQSSYLDFSVVAAGTLGSQGVTGSSGLNAKFTR